RARGTRGARGHDDDAFARARGARGARVMTTTAPPREPAVRERVLGAGSVAIVVRRRPVVVALTLLALALVAAVATLSVGQLGIPIAELPAVLAGNGSRTQEWTLFTSRLPRLAVAALAGAAFAVAGSIFQSVTR